MVKKSNVNIPAVYIIRAIALLSIGLVIFISYSKTIDFLTTSSLFAVRDVVVDVSIGFIDTTQLRNLKGRNIFKVDLAKVHRSLKMQYPYIDQLRVMRELPDRIKVLAKKREAAFQTMHQGKILLVDMEGVAMYYAPSIQSLPMVQGCLGASPKVILGAPLMFRPAQMTVSILRGLKAHPYTAGLKVTGMDVSNPSKIHINIQSTFAVILDQDNYGAKIELLNMLLAQKKINFNLIRYVDLRFNEPVMGEN